MLKGWEGITMKALCLIVVASAIAFATPAVNSGGCIVVKTKSGKTLLVHDGATKKFFSTNK